MNTRELKILIILVMVLAIPRVAGAIPYQLNVFTSNSTIDLSLLDLQVDVTSYATDGAIFTFYNYSNTPSSITAVYFDDGVLLGLSSIASSAGVSFDAPATPGNLPGGNALIPPFVTTSQFSADADSPPYHKGVNPVSPGDALEWVSIKFLLIENSDFNDVINSISDGSLRIGAHIQGLDDVDSESAVNDSVPEPGTMIFVGSLATGLFGIAGIRKKRK